MNGPYLAVDELQITRALGVTVAGSVLGTSLVALVLALSTIGVHRNEVQGSVQAAGEFRDVDVESELLVLEVERLVRLIVLRHQIGTRANVFTLDELELQRVCFSSDTIGFGVVRSLQGTARGAGLVIRAELLVPLYHLVQSAMMIQFPDVTDVGDAHSISCVAVVRALEGVQPAPVGIDDHGGALLSALAAFSTLLPGHGRVSFLLHRSHLLGANGSEESGDQERPLMHCE